MAAAALQVAAFRINDYKTDKYYSSSRPNSFNNYDNEYLNIDESDQSQSYRYNNMYEYNNNNAASRFSDRYRQNNQNEWISSSDVWSELQQQNNNRYQNNYGQYTGLVKKMADKVAAVQKIAVDYDIAGNSDDLDNMLNVNKIVVKLSDGKFVTFHDTTMNNLNNGHLEYMVVDPDTDTVSVEYAFDTVQTVGSIRSNVHSSKSGSYVITLKNVNSNVTTALKNNQHANIKPVEFQYADVIVKTEDGVETHEFDGALENRYMSALKNAVSAEVARSTKKGMVAQIKNEILRPMYGQDTESKGKLFDMKWAEDNFAMEMNNIWLQNPDTADEQLSGSVSFMRKSQNTYVMRYDFELEDLKWDSPLTVESSGKKIVFRPANFGIDKVFIQVAIVKSLDQQQACGNINTNVEVRGFRYNLGDNVQSELVSQVGNKLQRFFEHSLGSFIQESLRRSICYNGKY